VRGEPDEIGAMRRHTLRIGLAALGGVLGAGLPWPARAPAQAPAPFAPPGRDTLVVYRTPHSAPRDETLEGGPADVGYVGFAFRRR